MDLVCTNCMANIESHNGRQRKIKDIDSIPSEAIHYGYYDEDGNYVDDPDEEDTRSEQCCKCCWCDEMFPLEDIIIWD